MKHIHHHSLLSIASAFLALVCSGCTTIEPRTPARSLSQEMERVARESSRDQIVQLQIFLESQKFGPGTVEGKDGEFTRKALDLYRQANKLDPAALPDVGHITPYATYTITAEDLGALGTMALEPGEQALQKRLPYVRLTELLGERFHTTEAFLKSLNGGSDLNSLPPGAQIQVPNVKRPFFATAFPSQYGAASASVSKARRVVVDTRARMLHVDEGGRLIAAFPITPGSSERPAPLGEWKVAGAVPWPWYRYDKGVLERGERTEDFHNLPPGPNSPVGVLWAGLNRPGIGIHGTSTPETIGRAASAVCIRLSNWDAATFYTLVGKGVPVSIR